MAETVVTVPGRAPNKFSSSFSSAAAVVCVTGASGFIGSWLVMRLLERGYVVRATVRNPEDRLKRKHLLNLPNAEERLSLWKGNLDEQGSFDAAFHGYHGIFYCAVHLDFESADPERYLPDGHCDSGTMQSCAKAKTIRRFTCLSSARTVNFPGMRLETETGITMDELCWTDMDFYKKRTDDWMENDPHYMILRQVQLVHLDDLCRSLIFLYEHSDAKGRYISSSYDTTIVELAKMLAQKYKEFDIPRKFEDADENLKPLPFSSKKLTDIGFKFLYKVDDMFDGAIQTCLEKGLIQYPS